ncbi:TetR/AcrR family transcriptional regulator [Gordonia soli]|nr:TetR/AcrR family transcriptional regulator [Gordonia soli]
MEVVSSGSVIRGRPRDPSADRAILDAAFDLISAHGYAKVTVSAIIARAGTSSATVYRRWPTKLDLVAAAIASRRAEIDDIDTGRMDSDVASFVERLTEVMCLRPADLGDALVAELRREPGLSAAVADTMVAPRLRVIAAILDRARARGEIGEIPVDVAYSLVVGQLQSLTQVSDRALDDSYVSAAIVGATAALRAYPAARSSV